MGKYEPLSPTAGAELAEAAPATDPFGCMKGTVTIADGVDLTRPNEAWDADPDGVLNG